MSRPPFNPFKKNESDSNYFKELVLLVKPEFDKLNIPLNFKGYTKLIEEYSNLNQMDLKTAWNLTRDFSLWEEYIGDILHLTNKFLLDSETSKIEQTSIVSYEASEKTVSLGDRMANKDPRVVQARKLRNSFKAFALELENKQKFLEKAYHHCKMTYSLGNLDD